MKIIELRILPPIAVGRLGASPTPLAAFDLVVLDEKPLDYRSIVPKTTFEIEEATGKITPSNPSSIRFKDVDSLQSKNGKVRPVAPFLEVFAITDEAPDKLEPLTLDLLTKSGYAVDSFSWDVEVGNIKVFRRTGDENDKMYAKVLAIKDNAPHYLLGECANFLSGKTLPLGKIQSIVPSDEFPSIKLRFTPAEGKVYGTSLQRKTSETTSENDPIITTEDLLVYDATKGHWQGYAEDYLPPQNPNLYTNPGSIYAGYDRDSDGAHVSWGYFDDECDGFVSFHLKGANTEEELVARAYIGAGPPAYAPDTMPVRVVSDELEQLLYGPEIAEEVSIDEAEDIVRRALETVRLLNTAVMNGNPVDGRLRVASNMVSQDTNDFGRYYEPIMATSLVDNLALRALHERVFNGLASGAAPWFAAALRKPDEIGDLSNEGRRKMPAMMRGADARALTLTHRMINSVIKAAISAMFNDKIDTLSESFTVPDSPIKATNLTAQIHYRGEGNPISVLPRTAISNCFPGLEFDFRNLWRRAFKGIVLSENNNYVIDAELEYKDLIHCRMVAVDGKPTMVSTSGPLFPAGTSQTLNSTGGPTSASFMEWSNSLAHVLQKQGQEVICHFTLLPANNELVVTADDLKDTTRFKPISLEVNRFFEGTSAAFTSTIVQPGELTQGLCAPWQNDYRECACYYWAASRPDFVNVVADEKGLAAGDNWMTKKRTGKYLPDNLRDGRLLSYDDLFKNWQGELNFIIKGKDAIESNNHNT